MADDRRPIDQKGDGEAGKGGGDSNGTVFREATKRLAQQGQWRTPPLPVFAAKACAAAPPASSSAPSTTSAVLPTTPDEYARMLQEAYKRGAEAGARAQQQQPPAAAAAKPPPPCAVQYNNYATGAGATTAQGVRMNSVSYVPPAVPAAVTSNPSPGGGAPLPPAAAVSHSKSMPEMSSYRHVNDEEDKRKKRLARNRASARLRRLKKKNLVDSYEGEVGILETALSKLRSHRWGGSNTAVDHEALIEALSMERGQQPLTPEKRREMIQMIIAQQREQVNSLLECQLESWVLGVAAGAGPDLSAEDEELAHIAEELRLVLDLTPQQASQVEEATRGCVHEVQDLFTVGNCLESIHANRWLLDEGVDEVAGQFTSILNPSQLSKFLLWSDHNADQIEKLDYVNVLTGPVVSGRGPVFEFGVDEGMADGD